jgi:hypothetical protein
MQYCDGSQGRCGKIGIPPALGYLMRVLPRALLHLRTRPLLHTLAQPWRFQLIHCPMQLLWLCQRMQLLARPMQQLVSRPGITGATELYQLEPSRPLRPNMKRRLQHCRRQQCTYHGRYRSHRSGLEAQG